MKKTSMYTLITAALLPMVTMASKPEILGAEEGVSTPKKAFNSHLVSIGKPHLAVDTPLKKQELAQKHAKLPETVRNQIVEVETDDHQLARTVFRNQLELEAHKKAVAAEELEEKKKIKEEFDESSKVQNLLIAARLEEKEELQRLQGEYNTLKTDFDEKETEAKNLKQVAEAEQKKYEEALAAEKEGNELLITTLSENAKRAKEREKKAHDDCLEAQKKLETKEKELRLEQQRTSNQAMQISSLEIALKAKKEEEKKPATNNNGTNGSGVHVGDSAPVQPVTTVVQPVTPVVQPNTPKVVETGDGDDGDLDFDQDTSIAGEKK